MSTYELADATNNPGTLTRPTRYGYTYDGLGRLTHADGIQGDLVNGLPMSDPLFAVGNESYAFDRIGNFTSLARGVLSTSNTFESEAWNYQYGPSNSRLAAVIHQTASPALDRAYSYDLAGNQTTDDHRQITATTYGRANLPTLLQRAGVLTDQYLYDAQDMRIFKHARITETTDVKEFYLRDAMGREIGILDLHGIDCGALGEPLLKQKWQWFVFGTTRFARIAPSCQQLPELPGGALSMGVPGSYTYYGNTTLGAVSFYVHDHLGNARVVYTPTANCGGAGGSTITYTLEDVLDYYPYGKVLRNLSAAERYQSTHHERDGETGLDYRGARFYDSEVGRFGSLDPIADASVALSGYVYVAGNPIFFTDPSGRREDDFYFDENGVLVNRVKNDQPDRFFVQVGSLSYPDDAAPDGSTVRGKSFDPVYKQIDLEGDLGKMIRTVYAEAQGENSASKLAVAEVIRNRANDATQNSAATGWNAIFSNVSTYTQVVEQSGQFESVQSGRAAYSNPLSLLGNGASRNEGETQSFVESVGASIQAHNQSSNTAGGSVYFYSPYISAPGWTKDLEQVTITGVDTTAFKFYRFK